MLLENSRISGKYNVAEVRDSVGTDTITYTFEDNKQIIELDNTSPNIITITVNGIDNVVSAFSKFREDYVDSIITNVVLVSDGVSSAYTLSCYDLVEPNLEETSAQLAERTIYKDTVLLMVSDSNLKVGDNISTLGYYEVNDGGCAEYVITNTPNIEDDGFILGLDNGLKAELIIKNDIVNIRQLGGRSQTETSKYDNKPYMDMYLSKLAELTNRVKLRIPSGIWCFTPTEIYRYGGFGIVSEGNFIHKNISAEQTIIAPYQDNQEYIWSYGNGTNIMYNIDVGSLVFSASNFIWDMNKFVSDSIYTITDSMLLIKGCAFGKFGFMQFTECEGEALKISSSWELTFKKIIYRNIASWNGSVMMFENVFNGNVSNLTFDCLDFENVSGTYITFDELSFVTNTIIENIIIEGSFPSSSDSILEVTDASYDDSAAIKQPILNIKGQYDANLINNITINNFARFFAINDGVQYAHDMIMSTSEINAKYIDVIIGNIATNGIKKDFYLLSHNTDANTPNSDSKVKIGTVFSGGNNTYGAKLDIVKFPHLIVDVMDYKNKNYVGNYLSFDTLPFYDVYYLNTPPSSYKGVLTTDEDCLNKMQLAIQALKFPGIYNTVGRIYNIKGKAILARIKSEASTAKTLSLVGTIDDVVTTITYSVVGTDNYVWYELLHINEFDENTYIDILTPTDLNVDMYFDLIKYKDVPVIPNYTTIERPSNIAIGYSIIDVTLGKPIWYDGTNWVDATGTTV